MVWTVEERAITTCHANPSLANGRGITMGGVRGGGGGGGHGSERRAGGRDSGRARVCEACGRARGRAPVGRERKTVFLRSGHVHVAVEELCCSATNRCSSLLPSGLLRSQPSVCTREAARAPKIHRKKSDEWQA